MSGIVGGADNRTTDAVLVIGSGLKLYREYLVSSIARRARDAGADRGRSPGPGDGRVSRWPSVMPGRGRRSCRGGRRLSCHA